MSNFIISEDDGLFVKIKFENNVSEEIRTRIVLRTIFLTDMVWGFNIFIKILFFFFIPHEKYLHKTIFINKSIFTPFYFGVFNKFIQIML